MKFGSVLLVGDQRDCTHAHKLLFEKTNVFNDIHVASGGREAIDFLISYQHEGSPKPSIIIFNKEMRGMDGWQFLEEYDKISTGHTDETVLIMLTKSLNSEEWKRGIQNPYVTSIYNEQLDQTALEQILDRHLLIA